MKTRPLVIVTAVIGFTAGILVVKQVFPGATADRADAATLVPPRNTRSAGDREDGAIRPKATASTTAGKHDFASLVRASSRLPPKPTAVGRELARMDVGALKGLSLELAANFQEDVSPEEKEEAISILHSAAGELYRREGIRALDWVAGIPKEQGRVIVLSSILSLVTRDLPEVGKEWVERYRAELGDQWAETFCMKALAGANRRSAEDVLKTAALFRSDLGGKAMNLGGYAEDFDFHRLITGQNEEADFSAAVVYWAARDKEAAWGALDEVIKAGGSRGTSYFGSLFQGIVTLEGDEKAAAWTAGKLAEIPAEQHEDAIRSLLRRRPPNETLVKLVRAMPDEGDRVIFASELFWPERGESATVALRALASESLQTQALVRTAGRYAEYAARGNPPDQATRDFFLTTMEKLNFTAASREKVEAALSVPVESSGESE